MQYHTARFRLVPSLTKALNVPTPAVRRPGSVWVELPRPVATGDEPVGQVRIGYARASTVRQSLDTQLDSLKQAGVTRVFSEKLSTRATSRPELEKAVTLTREMRASGVAVTLVGITRARPNIGTSQQTSGSAARARVPHRRQDRDQIRSTATGTPCGKRRANAARATCASIPGEGGSQAEVGAEPEGEMT